MEDPDTEKVDEVGAYEKNSSINQALFHFKDSNRSFTRLFKKEPT
jgi:hypothetical protein